MVSLTVSAGALGLFLLLAAFFGSRQSGLDKIPSAHFTVPYSRLWLLLIRWKGKDNRTRIKIHKQLGPVVRIGPKEVSVNCVDGGTHLVFGKFMKDECLYGAFIKDVPFLLGMVGEDGKNRKRMLSQVYSKSYVTTSETLTTIMYEVLAVLKERLAHWAAKKKPIDALEMCKATLLDITTGWLYGTGNRSDTLRDKALREELISLLSPKSSLDGFFWRYDFGYLCSFLPGLGSDLKSKRPKVVLDAQTRAERLQHYFSQMNGKAYDAWQNRPSVAPTNVYEHLHGHLKRDDPDMTDQQLDALLTAELQDHIIAAHDATGTGLMYAIYHLSRTPKVQGLLREGIRSFKQIQHGNIDQLPMLDAVMNETLRVHAPNPGPFGRIVPDSGCQLAGRYDVPGRTIVSTSAWSMHLNADVFPSPEGWLPERWLEANASEIYEMRRWMWAFGSGSRMCIGNHYATRVFKEILVAIYAEFETTLEDPLANVEQVDALVAGPVADCLMIRVKEAPTAATG